jgi:hypothetical protein
MLYTDIMPYLITELVDCLNILYEILENLEDIRIALEKGRDPDFFLFWLQPFQNHQKILLIPTCYVFHHPLQHF